MTTLSTRGDERARRIWSIVDALRRYGTDSGRLSHAFSASHGLQPTDLQALVAIMSADGEGVPLTPGVLRRHLKLSSGGTSYVIDRLEKAGHVRRTRDQPGDHRVVHLRYTDRGMATGLAFFGPLVQRTNKVLDQFDDAELDVVLRFIAASADALHQHVTELGAAYATKGAMSPAASGHPHHSADDRITGSRASVTKLQTGDTVAT